MPSLFSRLLVGSAALFLLLVLPACQLFRPANPTGPAASLAIGYGPAYTTFERDGLTFVRGSMAFPTGRPESSAVLLEKTTPQDVLVGEPYSYTYTLINLTEFTVTDVVLTDTLTNNFAFDQARPAPSRIEGRTLTWEIGNLGPHQTRQLTVTGASPAEGSLTSCGIVTFNPVLCETIRVVRGALVLTAELPTTTLVCENLPVRFVLTNTGTGTLTRVQLESALPDGLATVEGEDRLGLAVGSIAAGEERQLELALSASRAGEFPLVARVSTAQGVEAFAHGTAAVAAPQLVVECASPGERFVGHPLKVCYRLLNEGDAAATDVEIRAAIPPTARLESAIRDGRVETSELVWQLDTLVAGEQAEVCATFVATETGMIDFTVIASATCAEPVSAAGATQASNLPD